MSNVTLSVVVPSVDIIFDDDTAAVITATDADTVLGVTPGATGLLVLATATAAQALDIIGAVGPTQADTVARQAVAAHAMAPDPHRGYAKISDLSALAELPGAGRAAVAAHAMAANPHRQYPTIGQMQIADASTAGLTMAHATSRAAHPDRPTFDQSILQSSFFGG